MTSFQCSTVHRENRVFVLDDPFDLRNDRNYFTLQSSGRAANGGISNI